MNQKCTTMKSAGLRSMASMQCDAQSVSCACADTVSDAHRLWTCFLPQRLRVSSGSRRCVQVSLADSCWAESPRSTCVASLSWERRAEARRAAGRPDASLRAPAVCMQCGRPGSERSTSLISRTWNWPAAAMNQSLVDGWDGWRQDASQRHGARRRRRRRTIFHYDLRRLHRTTPQRWYCMSGPSAETVTGYVNSLKIEQALLTEIIICLQMRVWYRRQSIGHMWFPRLLVFHCNYISI